MQRLRELLAHGGIAILAVVFVLETAISFTLVALAAFFVVRRRDRVLGTCPHCASRIPHESTHCAYCGSGIEPGEQELASSASS